MAKKAAKEKKPTLTLATNDKKKRPTINTDGQVEDRPKVKEKAKPIDVSALGKKKRRAKSTPEQTPVPVKIAPEQTKTPAPEPIRPIASEPKKLERRVRVLFVCTGNTCRSAMAQYIFEDYLRSLGKADEFDVSGAGLSALDGEDMSEPAKEALSELGITGFDHFARSISLGMVRLSDLVVCMTAAHKHAIGQAPNIKTVAELAGGGDVHDPYGGSLEDYRKVAAYLKYACPDIYDAAKKSALERM